MSENKDTMSDDAIEWLNEIRCWVNRCKDTEWGDDDQRIVDFITTALSAPRVPVIPGLDESISKVKHRYVDEGYIEVKNDDILNVLQAACAYAELQKGV